MCHAELINICHAELVSASKFILSRIAKTLKKNLHTSILVFILIIVVIVSLEELAFFYCIFKGGSGIRS